MNMKFQPADELVEQAQTDNGARHPQKPELPALLQRLLDRNPVTAQPRFASSMFDLKGY